MCGRYFFDNDTLEEVERLTGERPEQDAAEGDIYPSSEAIIITGDICLQAGAPVELSAAESGACLHAERMRWGFPGFQNNQLIINARAETALEKRMFADSLRNRRCIIPAKWFYEWDRDKNKVIFTWPESPVIYMAGFYDNKDRQNRYVILTTQANESMKKVHDRMPLILPENRIKDWIFDAGQTSEILQAEPPALNRRQDYEQLSLF